MKTILSSYEIFVLGTYFAILRYFLSDLEIKDSCDFVEMP